jgi:hypothetical protein
MHQNPANMLHMLLNALKCNTVVQNTAKCFKMLQIAFITQTYNNIKSSFFLIKPVQPERETNRF